MPRIRRLLPSFLIVALVLPVALAADRYLHVRVEENGSDVVRVSLPLAVVSGLIPAIETDDLVGGRIRPDEDSDEIDLRRVLAAIRDTPDGDFVTVRGVDGTVRVTKDRGFLLAHADDADDGGRVRVRVPLDVLDALLSGGPDELDLVAALDALAGHSGDDLVEVVDGRSRVRIWIDTDSGD